MQQGLPLAVLESNIHLASYVSSNHNNSNSKKYNHYSYDIRCCDPDINVASHVIQVKKTVYIGSYDTEVGAAAAVDAWHVSQGREAVNFPEPSPVPRQPADSADTHSDSDAVAEADESPQQNDPSHADEPAQLRSSPAKDHQHHAASLLNSLRPQAHSESAQVSNTVRRSHSSAYHGLGGSKSQRQSAAGALVAKAAGRSKPSRDGPHQGRNAFWRPRPVPNQSGCTGVSYADGKWRAQIGVDNVVHYLGRFQQKEDAAEAYEQAAMQRLVRQGASH